MLSRRISIKSTVDNAFPAGPRQDTEKIDSGKPVTFSGTSAVLPSKRLSAPSAWADGDQFGHKVDILSDSTNKRGDESVGGWYGGGLFRVGNWPSSYTSHSCAQGHRDVPPPECHQEN
jgi:hypothetical protein